MRFSELTPAQRIDALLDPGSFEREAMSGSLLLGRGCINARGLYVAATDPAVARGAIGVAEARGMAALLERARTEAVPVMLLLDSSGARVDEGLPALGAFREVLREALLARASGLPMLAVVGRACFGGASLLAFACSHRCYLAGARLAASGPAVIEGVAGAADFDSHDRTRVDALMGSGARIRTDAQGLLSEDALGSVAGAVATWLRDLGDDRVRWEPYAEHDELRTRLLEAGLVASGEEATIRDSARLAAVLPQGYQPRVRGEAFCALPAPGTGKAVFLGTLSRAPVGAATCFQLADWLIELKQHYPGSPVVLVLDADGHAATVADEQVCLSAYLVHLSLVVLWLRADGPRIVLWIPGRASGASYVTFAAPVDNVSALPSAQIEILPPAAVKQILKTPPNGIVNPGAMLAAGVADGLLDDRLLSYPNAQP